MHLPSVEGPEGGNGCFHREARASVDTLVGEFFFPLHNLVAEILTNDQLCAFKCKVKLTLFENEYILLNCFIWSIFLICPLDDCCKSVCVYSTYLSTVAAYSAVSPHCSIILSYAFLSHHPSLLTGVHSTYCSAVYQAAVRSEHATLNIISEILRHRKNIKLKIRLRICSL